MTEDKRERAGLATTIRKDLPAFAIFLLAGVLLALGIRAALNDDEVMAEHDHGAMQMNSEASDPEPAPAPAPGGLIIDLGNEICPIMRKPVNGRTFSIWNGLRVGHCCPPCASDLLEDPERLLDEAGIEWRGAAAAVKRYCEAAPDAQPEILRDIAARFTVVGED